MRWVYSMKNCAGYVVTGPDTCVYAIRDRDQWQAIPHTNLKPTLLCK